MSSNTVIVFGPTGGVGSFTALTAGELGAKVWLAMRDTSKSIPGLSSDVEKRRGYERIQADLTQPETVEAAVKKSGAKRAFIYLAHGMPEHMKATIQALKSAGIELVVFLSSYTITKPPAEVPQQEIIPWLHAGVEVNLEQILGPDGYVAVRPGGFATNALNWWLPGIKKGEQQFYAEDIKFDWTTPEDMGGVCGTILAKGKQYNQKIVYVAGPQFTSMKDAWQVVKKEAVTKDVKDVQIDEQQYVDNLTKFGVPAPVAKYIGGVMTLRKNGQYNEEFAHLEEGQENVRKYLNRPGFSFEDWVIKNKTAFQT